MTQSEKCEELLMHEVVRIDIMPQTALAVGVPFNLRNITSTAVTMSDTSALTDARLKAASLLSLNLTGDAMADAEMKEGGASHKPTEKREAAGIVRTHALTVAIETGMQTVKEKEKALQETDFHMVLSTYGGERWMAYGLPGTSQFTIDEQAGQSAQMTVKAVVMSMSGLIRILP